MANVKITELTADTNPASTDVLPIVDISADETKKVTIADLLENAGNGSAGAAAFGFDADPDTGMYRTGTNALAFTTGGTGRLFINSSGSVGIGLSNPFYKLEVDGGALGTTANDTVDLLRLKGTTGNGDQLIFETKRLSNGADWFSAAQKIYRKVDNTLMGFIQFGANNADLITFGESNTEYMRVDGNGNVGIGTSSALEKLHVRAGSSGVSSAITGVDGAIIESAAGRTGGLSFYTPNDRTAGIFFGDPQDNNKASYRYNHASDITVIYSNSGERLRINSSGNVGIGTTNPVSKLEVANDGFSSIKITANSTNEAQLRFGDCSACRIANTSNTALLFTTNSLERMRISNTGNVGIGTSNPIEKLHVVGNQRFEGYMNLMPENTGGEGAQITFRNPDKTTAGAAIDITSAANHFRIFQLNNNSIMELGQTAGTGGIIKFATAGSERLRIGSDGNVGIGASNPSSLLHIYGTTGSGGILIEDSSGSSDSPELEVIGKRSDANASPAFAGKICLAGNRTDAAVSSAKNIGTVLFGGNHTNGSTSNILYSASMGGISEGTFSNSTTMPTGLAFYTGSTGRTSDVANVKFGEERMRITSDGYVRLSSNSGGIQFNGDTAAANALDDYEEGTWTPGITAETGSFTALTTDIIKANYTKIGRIVNVQCFVRTDNYDETGASGALIITGLPFASQSGDVRTVGSPLLMEYNSESSFAGSFAAYQRAGSSTDVRFARVDEGTNSSGASFLQVSQLQTTSSANRNWIQFSLTYQAAL